MARADRLEGWSDKRVAQSAGLHDRADALAGMVPFGQPILVGHHSEGRHRAHMKRVAGAMDKAVENDQTAKRLAARAAEIRSQADKAVYSDDVDAVQRLQARVADLEAQRDRIKAYNESCRKAAKTGGTGDVSLLDDKQRADLESIKRVAAYQLRAGGGMPAYVSTNLSGRIKKDRDRLAQMGHTPEKSTPAVKPPEPYRGEHKVSPAVAVPWSKDKANPVKVNGEIVGYVQKVEDNSLRGPSGAAFYVRTVRFKYFDSTGKPIYPKMGSSMRWSDHNRAKAGQALADHMMRPT